MKTLVHSEELPITEIMVKVQVLDSSEFPIEIKIGRGTFKLQNPEQARLFALGILACLDAKEEADNWSS